MTASDVEARDGVQLRSNRRRGCLMKTQEEPTRVPLIDQQKLPAAFVNRRPVRRVIFSAVMIAAALAVIVMVRLSTSEPEESVVGRAAASPPTANGATTDDGIEMFVTRPDSDQPVKEVVSGESLTLRFAIPESTVGNAHRGLLSRLERNVGEAWKLRYFLTSPAPESRTPDIVRKMGVRFRAGL